jgi:hypothetical protein
MRCDKLVRPTTNIGKCSVQSCNSEATKLGMCDKHYMRLRKNGNVNELKRNETYQDKDVCLVKECTNKQRSKNLCNKHYTSFLRLKKNGEITDIESYLRL